MSPLLIARFTSARTTSQIWAWEASNTFLGSPTSVFSAGAMICFAAMASTNNKSQARKASTGEHGCRQFLLRCGQFFHLCPVDRHQEFLARGKVTIQSSRSNTGLFGDVVQAGIRSRTSERLPGHFQNALAIPLRILA